MMIHAKNMITFTMHILKELIGKNVREWGCNVEV